MSRYIPRSESHKAVSTYKYPYITPTYDNKYDVTTSSHNNFSRDNCSRVSNKYYESKNINEKLDEIISNMSMMMYHIMKINENTCSNNQISKNEKWLQEEIKFLESNIARISTELNQLYAQNTKTNESISRLTEIIQSHYISLNGGLACKCEDKFEQIKQRLDDLCKASTVETKLKYSNAVAPIFSGASAERILSGRSSSLDRTRYETRATGDQRAPSDKVASVEHVSVIHNNSSRLATLSKNQQLLPQRASPRGSTPLGLYNSAGYCYLNCVIQILWSCQDFRNSVLQYHRSDAIAVSNVSEDAIFVNDFCKLFDEMDHKRLTNIKMSILKVQSHFSNQYDGDDILQSFIKVLTKINNVTKQTTRIERTGSLRNLTLDQSFEKFKAANNGFVFDSFYGQFSHKTKCKGCSFNISESFQLFKNLSVPVPNDSSPSSLIDCINNFLKESYIESEDKIKEMTCGCESTRNRSLVTIIEITHAPKYLFIYLNRGSYFKNGRKNNNFVKSDMTLHLPTKNQKIRYQLISVVDHMGDNEGGHYYVKSCLEKHEWYILNDAQVSRLQDPSTVVTKNVIVFLFKKD